MALLVRDIVDPLLKRLRREHALVLTGARQTGKTTLCETLIPEATGLDYTYISFDDPDERLRFQQAAISILESIDTPLVVLDEAQKLPALFDPLKYVVDKQRKKRGAKRTTFLLTGSSQLTLLDSVKESLAGRVGLLHLYPFSLHEVLGGDGAPLLSTLWHGTTAPQSDVEQFALLSPGKLRTVLRKRDEHQHWGGYPPVWHRKETTEKLNWLKDYRTTYLERDITDVGQVGDSNTFVLVQKLLCARTGQLLSISEVARDASLAVNTVKRYITLLAMTFQCHLLHPYYENIGKRLVKSPKIYFPDAGLNRAILGELAVSSGAAYESWVFSELIKWKQLQPVEPDLFFYRTTAGLELDFLLAGERRVLPIEAKASSTVTYADGRALEAFMKEHAKAAPLGIVVYRGRELKPIRENIWAIPDWALFGGLPK